MRRTHRSLQAVLAAVVALVAVAQLLPGTSSSFTDAAVNSGNTVTAAADWTGPVIDAVELQKSQGGTTGKLRQGGTFYVFADVADSGNPASGVNTVTASVGNLATVATAAMSSGSWTLNGKAYNRRTALLTAKATLASGTYAWSVAAVDLAGNSTPATAGSSTVDNTAFTAADATTADGGGTPGLLQAGDKLTLTYNRPPEPSSIISTWTSGTQTTTVRLADGGGSGVNAQDLVGPVDAAGNPLPLGSVNLEGDFVAKSTSVNFANSTMVISGNSIVITLGTPDAPANLKTNAGNLLPVWTPTASAYDQFDDPASPTAVTQSGVAKKQF